MVQTLTSANGSSDKFDRIVNDLAETGLSICDDFISPMMVSSLAHEIRDLWQRGEFRHAKVGKGASLQLRPEIRNDRVHWLDRENLSPVQQPYFLELETLRSYINRNLFLGLIEYEGHFALYPPGAYYNVHYDRFVGSMERVVSCILYLNQDWQPEDGGALKIYAGNELSTLPLPMQVLPQGGRLVTFISDRFPHEVLPANRDRMSLTGWFRVRL